MFRRSLFVFLFVLAAKPVCALDITVDSDLKDWLGAAPSGNSTIDWTPRADAAIKWMVEDQTGGNRYLDPGWGGQDYDAEAIYVNRSATHINIAIVTGRAPDAGGYVAGDIAIDFGLDGIYEIGVVTLGDGVGLGSANAVYEVSTWNYGLWTAPAVAGDPTSTAFGLDHPTTIAAGNKIGDATLSYAPFAYNGSTGLGLGEYGDPGKHYVIEAAIPLALLGQELGSQAFMVHWTMACANDFVQIDPPGAVPVPASLGLLALGLIPLIGRRHRH